MIRLEQKFDGESCGRRVNLGALSATRFFKGNSSSGTNETANNYQVAADNGGVAIGAGAGAITNTINLSGSRIASGRGRRVQPTVGTLGAAPAVTITNVTNDPATAIAAIKANVAVVNGAAGVVNNLVTNLEAVTSQVISAFTQQTPQVAISGANVTGSSQPVDTSSGPAATPAMTTGELIGILAVVGVIGAGIYFATKS